MQIKNFGITASTMSTLIDKKDTAEWQAFKTVFYHSIVIIVLPVLCFFFSKIFIFDSILRLNTVASNVYSAVIAMIVLHVALGAFIYRAYFDTPAKPTAKAD